MTRLLTLRGACAYSGWSERYLRRLVAERRIAHLKDRRLLFFRVEDIDSYIDGLQRVEARPESDLDRRRLRRAR